MPMVTEQPETSGSIVGRARSGDAEAIAELLSIYRNYLHLLARVHIDVHLQAKADPSDLVQETCLMAARDLPMFRGVTEAEFVAWLRQILDNAGAAMLRKYKGTKRRDVRREEPIGHRFARLDQSSQALAGLVAAPDLSPSIIASRRESAVVLADAMAKLPSDYREVLVLYHLEGLPLQDVASRIKRSVSSVRALRSRAVIALRRIMKEPT